MDGHPAAGIFDEEFFFSSFFQFNREHSLGSWSWLFTRSIASSSQQQCVCFVLLFRPPRFSKKNKIKIRIYKKKIYCLYTHTPINLPIYLIPPSIHFLDCCCRCCCGWPPDWRGATGRNYQMCPGRISEEKASFLSPYCHRRKRKVRKKERKKKEGTGFQPICLSAPVADGKRKLPVSFFICVGWVVVLYGLTDGFFFSFLFFSFLFFSFLVFASA